MRTPSTSFDGRAGFGEAPTTAIVRTLVRMSRIASSLSPSMAGTAPPEFGPALFEKGGHSLDAVRVGQIVDYRLRGERVSGFEWMTPVESVDSRVISIAR